MISISTMGMPSYLASARLIFSGVGAIGVELVNVAGAKGELPAGNCPWPNPRSVTVWLIKIVQKRRYDFIPRPVKRRIPGGELAKCNDEIR